jgi:hypothetical protein
MAMTLPIEHTGGWYPITAPANDRRAIFRDEWDRHEGEAS